jgi:bifunctional UDP-N-acetylglucosamine pyrophosphorylase / glucosamine-1-phosphate N-acetyltransferase
MPRKDPKAALKPSAKAPRRPADRSSSPAPLHVVVLAAGRGTRMHSRLPKVMQPLAGRPLLAHVLDLAAQLAPASVHVVYGHGGELLREHFAHAPVQWALQAQQLGTGHALLQAMPAIPDAARVLVLYGDVPLLRADSLRALIERAHARDLAILTAAPADPTGYGRVLRDARGGLRRIAEELDATARERATREVHSGVMLAPAAPLRKWLRQLQPRNAQGEFYLTDVFALALKAGARVLPVKAGDYAEVLGVNDKLQLAAAESEYRRRRARELMGQGATLIDPARIDVRGEVTVGRDVLLDVNVVLDGPVHLADGVRIGPNCVLANASVGAGTVVHANCVVHDAQIGAGCQIGPFTRLRPQTRLADGVHLGNFVEIKNSLIGEGSKVNHLSYVGDTDIGSRVNVGAGTITCNYDGANKWRTDIGSGAFIGSGTMLVAPVKVGDGATIGAGSTITSDVPADKLTLARSRQVTIEQWERPGKLTGKS